jgi:hypothetical protein
MKVSIEDLHVGDVVLVAASAGLYEAKILRQPRKAKKGRLKTWRGAERWVAVLCAVREETFTYHSGTNRQWSYIRPVIADGKEYNKEKRINFTERECWLIKREKS